MNDEANQQATSRNDEYIRFAYQSALEDIRFFKRQQWMVTNYTFLAYGAIVAILKLSTVKSDGKECLPSTMAFFEIAVIKIAAIEWAVFAIVGIIAAVSIYLIYHIQSSTKEARDRKVDTGNRIPYDLQSLFFKKPPEEKFLDNWSVFGLLAIVIIGGGFLAIWVLSTLSCPG